MLVSEEVKDMAEKRTVSVNEYSVHGIGSGGKSAMRNQTG